MAASDFGEERLCHFHANHAELPFQGFAFLPIAIAWTLGGTFGGWIYHNFGRLEVGKPEIVFLIIGLVGVAAAIMMFVYNLYMKRNS